MGALAYRDRFGHEAVACSDSEVPPGTEWCPECNGYGSAEETERCTRCGGSGLVMVADEREQGTNGHDPGRLGHFDH